MRDELRREKNDPAPDAGVRGYAAGLAAAAAVTLAIAVAATSSDEAATATTPAGTIAGPIPLRGQTA